MQQSKCYVVWAQTESRRHLCSNEGCWSLWKNLFIKKQPTTKNRFYPSSVLSIMFVVHGMPATDFPTKVFFFYNKDTTLIKKACFLVWLDVCFNHRPRICLELCNEACSSWSTVGTAALISGPWTLDYGASTQRSWSHESDSAHTNTSENTQRAH